MASAPKAPVPVLPEKAFFRIGEVAEILDVKPYVIRYWESEFRQIKPVKSSGNQRVYSRADVNILMTVKTLLWDEKYTIEGARNVLSARHQPAAPALDTTQSPTASPDGAPSPEQPDPGPLFSQGRNLAGKMKSFLATLDELRADNQKIVKKLEQAEARIQELEVKLSEERKMRTCLISYLQKEFSAVINLLDSRLREED